MRTHDVFGINNGLEPDEKGPVVRTQTVELDTSGFYIWDSNGGQGSSVYATKRFQTIYVDNSLGNNTLVFTCLGTRHTFKVPAKTQCYLPLVALLDDYSFKIEGGESAQVFQIALFNIMLPSIMWTI